MSGERTGRGEGAVPLAERSPSGVGFLDVRGFWHARRDLAEAASERAFAEGDQLVEIEDVPPLIREGIERYEGGLGAESENPPLECVPSAWGDLEPEIEPER